MGQSERRSVHWGVGKMIWMDGWVGWVGSDRVRLVEHVYYKVVGVVVKGRGEVDSDG